MAAVLTACHGRIMMTARSQERQQDHAITRTCLWCTQ